MSDISKPTGSYLPSLDGLRAVSIIIVALKHAFPALPMASGFGVTIFFCISGYLITTLLYRELAKSGRIDFAGFYKRRVLRLAPPLVITMILGATLLLFGKLSGTLDPMIMLSQLFFFYNYYGYGSPSLSIEGLQLLWSLAVEEHFYLVFPFLLLVSVRRKWRADWLVWLSLAILGWRIVKFSALGYMDWQIYAYTDTRVDSMLWGCFLAAVIEHSDTATLQRIDKHRTALLIIGFAMLGISFVVRDPLFRSTLVYTLRGVGMLPIFFFAVLRPSMLLFRPLNWAWVRKIGLYSYTIYLAHVVLLSLIWENVPQLGTLASGSIGLLLSGLYAAAMFNWIEKPIKAHRERMNSAKKSSGAKVADPENVRVA